MKKWSEILIIPLVMFLLMTGITLMMLFYYHWYAGAIITGALGIWASISIAIQNYHKKGIVLKTKNCKHLGNVFCISYGMWAQLDYSIPYGVSYDVMLEVLQTAASNALKIDVVTVSATPHEELDITERFVRSKCVLRNIPILEEEQSAISIAGVLSSELGTSKLVMVNQVSIVRLFVIKKFGIRRKADSFVDELLDKALIK